MTRLQDPRLQGSYVKNTVSYVLDVFVFSNNVPWWDADYTPTLRGLFRPCVMRLFWSQSMTFREEHSDVIKRRGSTLLFEIGKQRKRALGQITQVIGVLRDGTY